MIFADGGTVPLARIPLHDAKIQKVAFHQKMKGKGFNFPVKTLTFDRLCLSVGVFGKSPGRIQIYIKDGIRQRKLLGKSKAGPANNPGVPKTGLFQRMDLQRTDQTQVSYRPYDFLQLFGRKSVFGANKKGKTGFAKGKVIFTEFGENSTKKTADKSTVFQNFRASRTESFPT